jgi:SAM-dependent methyltransferase
MVQQTMSNTSPVPEELVVGRGDPAYMAHAYLTKVPVPAILPFIEAYTQPGDLVVDPFAGSGMTGVAAAMCDRRGRLFDISVLGQHIGRNYVNLVDGDPLRKQAAEVVEASQRALSAIYSVFCAVCGKPAEIAKSVWSIVVACAGCGDGVNFYHSLERAGWRKSEMQCPNCSAPVTSKLPRIGEEPVADYVNCECSPKQLEQDPDRTPPTIRHSAAIPKVEITSDRQMYQASALGKHGLTSVASFYSERNLAVLASLREQLGRIDDSSIREKLLFAFTASLTRASKRYQWSRQRPLNAANSNYYVAMVFYEWNVYELFLRKVEAAIRSDEWIGGARSGQLSFISPNTIDVEYQLASADGIPLPDGSADYVFTDPPFGSNLFYADMALFQEAWLDGFTDHTIEAVIDRGKSKVRTADRYEALLTKALSECARILKPGGRVSLVFGNSTGEVWSLLQRAIAGAGLTIEPDALVVLNKGQRSVKGLASGFEHVATLDLIITMTFTGARKVATLHSPTAAEIADVTHQVVASGNALTPSHVYLELLRHGIQKGWELADVDLRTVTTTLHADGWTVDDKSGRMIAADQR